MKSAFSNSLVLVLLAAVACSGRDAHGIADKRSDFASFLPMGADPARDGLKEVKPFFHRADRGEIIRVIEHACVNRRKGSSVYDRRTGAGYYVNCSPGHKQLLNGYIPADPKQEPHSH